MLLVTSRRLPGHHAGAGDQQRDPHVGVVRRALAAAEPVLPEVEAVVGGQHDVGVGADGAQDPLDRPVGRLRHPRAVAQVALGDGRREGRHRVPRPGPRPVGGAGAVVAARVAEAGEVVDGELAARHPAAAALAGPVAEHRREERVAGVVPLGLRAVVRGVDRDLEEVRRVAGLAAAHEVQRVVADHGAGVGAVLLGVGGRRGRRRVLDDLHPLVDDRRAGEVPAVVGGAEDRVEGAPARHDGGQGAARHPLVLVEELAHEGGGVAGLLQTQVERALGVAVGVVGRPPAEHRGALVGGVGAHARLVGVLPGEEARARHAAQRVGDERVRIARTDAAHLLRRAHGLDEVGGEVVEHHHHDVGPAGACGGRQLRDRPRRRAAVGTSYVVGGGRPLRPARHQRQQAHAHPRPPEVMHLSPVVPARLPRVTSTDAVPLPATPNECPVDD